MLRASRRLLGPNGRTAFFTIHPAPCLSASQRRRAHRDGPVAVAARRAHRDMLQDAGFVDIDEIDCTTEFAQTARAWVEQCDTHREHLIDLQGVTDFEQRQHDRRAQLRAVEEGLLQRSLFIAARPED